MSIRKKYIYAWTGFGFGYESYPLHTNKITTPSICVRIGGETLYCPLASGSANHALNVRASNTTYHADIRTPTLSFQAYCSQDTSTAYRYGYTYSLRYVKFTQTGVSLRYATSIQCKIVGETSVNPAGTWTNMVTLPANSNSMSNPSSIRVLGSSQNQSYFQVRILVNGNVVWTSGNYARYTWYSISQAIPSNYW